MRQLYNTARVYQDEVTLHDPPSGESWSAIVPRPRPAELPPLAPPPVSMLDQAAKKLDEVSAAVSKKFDEAAASASKSIDDAKAAATKAIDDVLDPAPDPSRV